MFLNTLLIGDLLFLDSIYQDDFFRAILMLRGLRSLSFTIAVL